MKTLLIPVLLLTLSLPALAAGGNNNDQGQNNNDQGQNKTRGASWSRHRCGPSPTSNWRRHLLDRTPPKKGDLISYT